MKKYLSTIALALATTGIIASPATASTPGDPWGCTGDAPGVIIFDTTLPASGIKELSGGTCGGSGLPLDATFIAPSGAERVQGMSDENMGWIYSTDEVGTWSVYVTDRTNGKTSVIDTFVLSPATAPQPNTTTPAPVDASKCATRKEFRKIKRGMTPRKVKSIVGSKGRASVSADGLRVRQWGICSTQYGLVTVTFRHSRVSAKSYQI